MKTKLLLGIMLLLPIAASADMYSFQGITNTNAANTLAGEQQMSLEVLAYNSNQVKFIFTNSGPAASSICDIYFDDNGLLAMNSIVNGTGVKFSALATPGELPGANNALPKFVTTAGLSADSDSPVQPNGVNPGESLTIIMSLINGKTFNNVISDLQSGDLRVGIHVQGFANGGSESLITHAIPAHNAVILGIFGLAQLGWMRRRYFSA